MRLPWVEEFCSVFNDFRLRGHRKFSPKIVKDCQKCELGVHCELVCFECQAVCVWNYLKEFTDKPAVNVLVFLKILVFKLPDIANGGVGSGILCTVVGGICTRVAWCSGVWGRQEVRPYSSEEDDIEEVLCIECGFSQLCTVFVVLPNADEFTQGDFAGDCWDYCWEYRRQLFLCSNWVKIIHHGTCTPLRFL